MNQNMKQNNKCNKYHQCFQWRNKNNKQKKMKWNVKGNSKYDSLI